MAIDSRKQHSNRNKWNQTTLKKGDPTQHHPLLLSRVLQENETKQCLYQFKN